VDAYTNLVKELFLETVEVTAADVNALVAFREENQIDFEVCLNHLKSLSL
jgi:hypothetical protein